MQWVNAPATVVEEEAMRLSIVKGRPFGDEAWQMLTAQRLGLQSAYRETGRPRKHPGKQSRRDREATFAGCMVHLTEAVSPPA